jgi:hypothetical protein
MVAWEPLPQIATGRRTFRHEPQSSEIVAKKHHVSHTGHVIACVYPYTAGLDISDSSSWIYIGP